MPMIAAAASRRLLRPAAAAAPPLLVALSRRISTAFREERDTFGPIQVPADKPWGTQTQRSLQKSDIGGERERMPEPIIRGLGVLKKCAAKENPRRTPWESSVYCNMKLPFRMPGNNSAFSTIGHSGGELSGQDNSAASPDPDQPRYIKFKRPDKTARNIINILNKEALEKVKVNREFPDIRPGYIIQLKVEVPENKRRLSSLKGIVIAMHNKGVHTTFRLRRLVAGVGVESVFPLYSPNIKELKVVDKIKVRRAKLYYLRDRMNPLKK